MTILEKYNIMAFLKKYNLIILIVTIVTVFLVVLTKSKFGDSSYGPNCLKENPNMPNPSGNLPASYTGLTKSEQENLLTKFASNNPNIN